MLASSFSTRFLLRKNRRSRLPAPPFGFAAQKRARHFAARNHPVRLSASRPWLRHPAPLFCRPRHGCAAPGPQRQNPGACSHSVAFRLRRNRAAGRCPHWGQRARSPHFRFAQMWPRARTPALLVFNPVFSAQKPAGASPPAFGRRGVDKVRKYHFVCVVLSSAPLTLSPLYAPARPVFRNRPKEKAAAENRCGCEHAIYEL